MTSLSQLGWRGRHSHQLALIGYACLAGWALHAADTAPAAAGITAIGLLAGAVCYRHARAIADMATSRIGSAAQGYVEVMGRSTTDPAELLLAPCSQIPCVWYRYRVYSREDAHSPWQQIDSVTSHTTFGMSDATGTCRVDPEHAEVMGAEQRVSYRDGDKLVEELLRPGQPIYVLGEFATLRGSDHAVSLSAEVGELLARWKQDPAQLKRRFDLDGNGQIDLHEWELARRLATRTVERQHRDMRQHSELHLVRSPANGRLFLISALPPQQTRRRYLAWSILHLSIAALGLGLLLHVGR